MPASSRLRTPPRLRSRAPRHETRLRRRCRRPWPPPCRLAPRLPAHRPHRAGRRRRRLRLPLAERGDPPRDAAHAGGHRRAEAPAHRGLARRGAGGCADGVLRPFAARGLVRRLGGRRSARRGGVRAHAGARRGTRPPARLAGAGPDRCGGRARARGRQPGPVPPCGADRRRAAAAARGVCRAARGCPRAHALRRARAGGRAGARRGLPELGGRGRAVSDGRGLAGADAQRRDLSGAARWRGGALPDPAAPSGRRGARARAPARHPRPAGRARGARRALRSRARPG